MDSAEDVAEMQDLLDLGFSSMAAVQLIARLQKVVDPEIPVSAIYDYPTVEAVAGYLNRMLTETGQACPGPYAAA
jgi:acyl carrier protein